MKYSIFAKSIYLENQILQNTWVTVDNGVISAIGEKGGEEINLPEYKLLPGFIDMHIHGGNGIDTMEATYEAIDGLSAYKIKEGVTSFCPTTVTATLEETEKALLAISEAYKKGVSGAEVLGPFIEGPYINPSFKGAHAENRIRKISLSEIEGLIKLCKGKASIIIAPELEGAAEAIKWLHEAGVNVRLGHTAATFETAMQAIDNGASVAVHTYNAMSPFTSREPGMVGASLINNNVYSELICDLHHSHKASAEILYKIKNKNKIVLVTDCMAAGGLSDGDYYLGELKVIVKDSVARIEAGNLAGSTVRMIDAVKNMVEVVGASLSDAVNMASINPAAALGLNEKYGSIAINKKADLIAIDNDYNIKFVMKNGKVVNL